MARGAFLGRALSLLLIPTTSMRKAILAVGRMKRLWVKSRMYKPMMTSDVATNE